jgi:hypothetical protein
MTWAMAWLKTVIERIKARPAEFFDFFPALGQDVVGQ